MRNHSNGVCAAIKYEERLMGNASERNYSAILHFIGDAALDKSDIDGNTCVIQTFEIFSGTFGWKNFYGNVVASKDLLIFLRVAFEDASLWPGRDGDGSGRRQSDKPKDGD